MTGIAAIVNVKPVPGGVELHAVSEGQQVVLSLDALLGLTLADDITRACEQRVPAGGRVRT